jgi:hypothetical protein
MKFMAKVCPAFFARHMPVSTIAKPACMNMTKKPVTIAQTMLIENRLCAMRSYRSPVVSAEGTSPLPSPAGVAQTPAAAPVGSGQVAGFPSVFAQVK